MAGQGADLRRRRGTPGVSRGPLLLTLLLLLVTPFPSPRTMASAEALAISTAVADAAATAASAQAAQEEPAVELHTILVEARGNMSLSLPDAGALSHRGMAMANGAPMPL